jgi:hypothetical protein
MVTGLTVDHPYPFQYGKIMIPVIGSQEETKDLISFNIAYPSMAHILQFYPSEDYNYNITTTSYNKCRKIVLDKYNIRKLPLTKCNNVELWEGDIISNSFVYQHSILDEELHVSNNFDTLVNEASKHIVPFAWSSLGIGITIGIGFYIMK